MSDRVHDRVHDPVRDAWTEVGAGFSSLGESISSKFKHADDTAPAAGDGDAGPQEDPELRAAFDRFVAAGRELGDRVAGVGRDDEVRTRARDASQKLDDALVATVDLITDRLAGLVGRSARERSGTDATAPGSPPATPSDTPPDTPSESPPDGEGVARPG